MFDVWRAHTALVIGERARLQAKAHRQLALERHLVRRGLRHASQLLAVWRMHAVSVVLLHRHQGVGDGNKSDLILLASR